MGLVKKHHVFIEESLNIILETKPKNVAMLADLYVALFEQDPPLIHADALLTGFQKAFEQAEDLAIDVPGMNTGCKMTRYKSYTGIGNAHMSIETVLFGSIHLF